MRLRNRRENYAVYEVRDALPASHLPGPPADAAHPGSCVPRSACADGWKHWLTRARSRWQEGGLTPFPDSLGYISEADRFITDIAGVNKAEREVEIEKREQMYYNRRVQNTEQEEERWRTIEVKHQIEQKRLEEMRENYSYARSNKTSMPYNPINLQYDNGADGDRLRFSDESLRYRGAMRAEHLQRRGASTPHNPITGAPIERVHIPEAPQRPIG